MKKPILIPRPQKFTFSEGMVDSSVWGIPRAGGVSGNALDFICEKFGKPQLIEDSGFFLHIGSPRPAEVPEKPDAYVISITENGLALEARNYEGLFYGMQTLRHISDNTAAEQLSVGGFFMYFHRAGLIVSVCNGEFKGSISRHIKDIRE